ncbi:MAG: BCCT family transporter [Blautia faecis]
MTTFTLKTIVNSVGHMIEKLPRMALFTDPISQTGFRSMTVVLYRILPELVAMMGIFIAKVSKGRTIREVAIYTIFIMTAGGMIIFGIVDFAMYEHLQGSADVVALVNSILRCGHLSAAGTPVVRQDAAAVLILVLVVGFVAPSMDSASLLAETDQERHTEDGTSSVLLYFTCDNTDVYYFGRASLQQSNKLL